MDASLIFGTTLLAGLSLSLLAALTLYVYIRLRYRRDAANRAAMLSQGIQRPYDRPPSQDDEPLPTYMHRNFARRERLGGSESGANSAAGSDAHSSVNDDASYHGSFFYWLGVRAPSYEQSYRRERSRGPTIELVREMEESSPAALDNTTDDPAIAKLPTPTASVKSAAKISSPAVDDDGLESAGPVGVGQSKARSCG
ncbi:hypothetical protein HDU78_001956 [Chytriomyces hyalinus]|nr:hypothetical protein HDU78_001956 [Chytriomyces hyalinus]